MRRGLGRGSSAGAPGGCKDTWQCCIVGWAGLLVVGQGKEGLEFGLANLDCKGQGTSLGRIRETRVVRAEVPSRTVEDGIGLLMTRRVIPTGPKV